MADGTRGEVQVSTTNEVLGYEQEPFIVDVETGKVVSIRPNWLPEILTTTTDIEMFMDKVSIEEAKVEALIARRKQILENLDTMITRHTNKRDYLMSRYGSQLRDVALRNLPRDRKTYETPFGSVTFRKTQAKIVVTDTERAIDNISVICPEAVKTERSILLSKLPEDIKASILNDEAKREELGFRVEPEKDCIKLNIMQWKVEL
jgi:hypothetical protein